MDFCTNQNTLTEAQKLANSVTADHASNYKYTLEKQILTEITQADNSLV